MGSKPRRFTGVVFRMARVAVVALCARLEAALIHVMFFFVDVDTTMARVKKFRRKKKVTRR